MSIRQGNKENKKRVSLFITCMADALYPEVGIATVKIFEHLGLEVDFPKKQICCGQPGGGPMARCISGC